MRESTHAAADPDLELGPDSRPRRNSFVKVASGPDLADVRDTAGAQRGMVILLAAGGLFWAAVGAAALYFLQR